MSEAVGFFRPGAGWLHRLNPYPKLLLLVWGVLAPFVLPAYLIPVLIVAYLAAGLSAGLGRPYLRAALIAPLVVVLPIVLINGFFYPGRNEVIFAIGPLALTVQVTTGIPLVSLSSFSIDNTWNPSMSSTSRQTIIRFGDSRLMWL